MTQKVIYVSLIRLTDKVARDWYVDYLIERGVQVEYWDVVSLLREEHSERGARDAPYLRVFRSFAEFERRVHLPENRDALYVLLVSYGGRFLRPFRLLSKHRCRMAFINWGAMPQNPTSLGRKIRAGLARPVWLVNEVFYRAKAIAYRKLKLVNRFEVVFAAGDVLLRSDQYAERVVPVNLCDYDHYARVKRQANRYVEGRYCVFLDINLPYQSDLAICGYPQIDPVNYYRSLNRFFGRLEAHYGLQVVIAAHPKADYRPETFEGRASHRLVTAELVRDAQFVLSHTSTALSYAVLNGKPLVFISTDDMVRAYEHTIIREMRCYADYLDAPMYNIDRIASGAEVVTKDPSVVRYERYKYNFLTSHESEHTPTEDIFWREVTASTPAGVGKGAGYTAPSHAWQEDSCD
jgi:hypothetical protein